MVQPSCCLWGDDGHELVLGLLAHPSLPPQMDPVQKAVLSHTFGGPLLKTKRPIISCNVCQIRFNSQVRSPATLPPNEWGRGSQGYLGGGQRLGALSERQGLRGYQGKSREWGTTRKAGDTRRHLSGIRDGCIFQHEVDQSTKDEPSLPWGLGHPWLRTSWNIGGHQCLGGSVASGLLVLGYRAELGHWLPCRACALFGCARLGLC